ncbi:hypothetical protein BVC80_2977g1 [Macleaya cordata]|uniref:ubiquitinyl hydrolase 1 n=1 Tax=Macleaya cordata TaxID=56857 RepID=A0A200PRX7_MACCD|nr:hypothetical protein BVC80_2977g1 [Macleaya cordata]
MTCDILYYEVLDTPVPELQGLKTLNITFCHATKDEVLIRSVTLPTHSTVGDVINDLKAKVEMSHPNAKLRLLGVRGRTLLKIFPLNQNIETIFDRHHVQRRQVIISIKANSTIAILLAFDLLFR